MVTRLTKSSGSGNGSSRNGALGWNLGFVDSTDRQFDPRNGRLVPSVLGLVGYRVKKESQALNYAKTVDLPLRLHDNYSRPCKPLPKRCEIGNDGDLLLHGIKPTANVKPNWSLWRRVLLLKNGDPGLGRKAGIVPNPKSQNSKSALVFQAPAYAHDDSLPYGRIREDNETNRGSSWSESTLPKSPMFR